MQVFFIRQKWFSNLGLDFKYRPRFDGLKKVAKLINILEPFTAENGLLTVSNKMKRMNIQSYYAEILCNLYVDADNYLGMCEWVCECEWVSECACVSEWVSVGMLVYW